MSFPRNVIPAKCHSRERGNPDPRFHGDDVFLGDDEDVIPANAGIQIPAFAGMTVLRRDDIFRRDDTFAE
ncbi:MAG: hypothetical protein A3F16_05265 [Deltaproteobacteria bacterium RIFCSPHIGHO2_12_FULL_43_9]|nr:MAG: hypothetical protein A3F16_05265 [Deltaproteobacteria bacterium RIFCSPHIGHO2_12_FULL_43_9]